MGTLRRMDDTMSTETQYPDIMIDIETTGLQPDRSAILQIAAVKFNLKTREVSNNFFNRMLKMPKHRHWDQATLQWWNKDKRELLQTIMAKGEEPTLVFEDLTNFARGPGNTFPIFWSKPTHFDFMFLSSYYHDVDMINPFCYRSANDMNTFIRSQYYPEPVPDLKIPFEGTAHHALFDCINQIKVLFAHMEDVDATRNNK